MTELKEITIYKAKKVKIEGEMDDCVDDIKKVNLEWYKVGSLIFCEKTEQVYKIYTKKSLIPVKRAR